MSKGFASSSRLVLLSAGMFACFGALGARLIWLHVIEREELLGTIARTRTQLIPEAARRGDILDARGARLATSRSVIVLGVDPHSLLRKDEKKWPELAALLEMPEAELRRIFTRKYREPPAPPVPAASASAAVAALGINLNVTPGVEPRGGVEAPDEAADEGTADAPA
ncbi:MAG: hypothetical protein FJ399_20245, partial [Verrucomicrobia bacterium]|nr:hypothetical protein [Verrucomicrobiota bacterium]